MWSGSTEDQQMIAELSKEMITHVAPEELDIFDDLLQGYFENPQPPDRTVKASDDPLGFGLGEVMNAMTPIAAAVATAALNFLLQAVLKAAQDETVAQVRRRLKPLFEHKAQAEKLSLTPEQLRQLRDTTRASAEQYGLTAKQAAQLTNALLVALMLDEPAKVA
jgi:hypothetical protein